MKIRRKQVWESWRDYFKYVYKTIIIHYEPLRRDVDTLKSQIEELRSQLKRHRHICPSCGANVEDE